MKRRFVQGWCTLLAGVAVAGAAPPSARVAPGTVAVWRAAGTERCGQGAEEWPALDDACWFAIDLLTGARQIEVRRWRDGIEERALLEVGEYGYPVQRITLPDDSRVNLSAADQERVARESERIGRLWSLRSEPRFVLPLREPLATLPEGGRFGHRRYFNEQPRSPHSGADYAALEGTPVLAAAAGRVVLAGDLFFSGNSVFLDHGGGLVSMYFHLREIAVAEGGEVEAGQRIGVVGQTGRATGPHLHFGLRWRGARVDPEQLLSRASPGEIR